MSRSDMINNFLDAMSLIANKAAEDVNQDKTVIMQVKAAEENSYTLTYNSVDYSTIVSEEKYAVGDYVYVTCIGGIDGSEKVILHKVPNQTGLSTTIQKPEYVVQGIPFISIDEIDCGDTVTTPTLDCNSLAAYLKVHKLLRIKAKVTTDFNSNFYLDEDGTNFTKNFGLKFVFNLVDGTTKSVSLDTNSMSGFPYDLNNEWQEAIIEFEEAEALKISSLNSIECFIADYSLANDESITFEEITLSVVKPKGDIGSLSAQVVNLSNDLKIDTTSGINDEVKLQVVFSSPEELNFTPGYRWYIINQDNVDDWEDSPFNSTSGIVLSQSNLLSKYNNIKCIWGKIIDGAVEKIGEANFEIENITGLSVVGSREIQDSQFNLSIEVLSSSGSSVTEGITYKWKETDYLGETRELSSSATLTIDPYTNVTVRSEYTGFAYKDSTYLGSTDTYVIYQAVKSGSTISNIYNLYTVTATNSPPESPDFSDEGVVLDPWYSSIPGNYGEDYKYLWSCAAMKMSDGTILATTPELSFVYGEGGAEGAAGRSVVDFHWYYNTNRDAGSWEGDRITVDANDNLVEADWTKEKPSDSSLEEGECLWETQVIEYDKRGGKADSKYQIGAPSLKTYLKLEESGVSLTTNGDYFIYKEDKTISPSVIIIEKNVYGRAREVKNWSWEYGVEGASGITWQSVPNYSNNAAICKSQDGDDVYVRQNAMTNRDTVFIKVTGSLGEDENKVEYTDGCNLIRVPAGQSTVNYVWSNPVMTFSADEDGKVPANQQEVATLTVLEGATNITNKITGFNFISAGSDNPPNVTISTSGAQVTMKVGNTANNFGAAGTLKGTLNFEFTYEGKTYNPSLKWIKNAKGDDAISITIPNSSFTFDDSATGETHTAQVLVTKGGAALSYAASQATSGDGWYYMVSSTNSYVTNISANGVKISKPSATSDIPVTIKVYQGTSLKIEKTLNVSCTVFKPAYSMDLDNDTDTVPADKEGSVPDGGLSGAKSSMTVLYGIVQQNLSTTNCSVTVPTGLELNTHYTFSIVNNVATFSLISYPASFADSLSIVFNYKIGDTETISKTFTITKIRSEDPVDYYLELSPSAINTTSSGGTVQVRVKQRKGQIISNVTGTIGTVTPSTGNAFSSTSGSSSDPYYAYSYSQNQVGEVIFTLKIDDVEWERETLLMTKNGVSPIEYDLYVSPATFNRTDTPAPTITVTLLKIQDTVTEDITNSSYNNIEYSYDSGTTWTPMSATSFTWTEDKTNALVRYKISDNVYKTVNITTSVNGTPATQYYSYIKYADAQPDSNDDMYSTPTSDTKWVGTYSGTVQNPGYALYAWSEYKGATVSVIYSYYLSPDSSAPDVEKKNPVDGTKNGWSLIAQNVDLANQYQYVSQATKTNGTLGSWSTAVLWNKYSPDGTSVEVNTGFPKYKVTNTNSVPEEVENWSSSWNDAIKNFNPPYYVWTWIQYKYSNNRTKDIKTASFIAINGESGSEVASEFVWLYYGSNTSIKGDLSEPFNIEQTNAQNPSEPILSSNWSFDIPTNTYIYRRSVTKITTTPLDDKDNFSYKWQGPWSAPELYSFRNSSNPSYLDSVALFSALCANEEGQGIYYGRITIDKEGNETIGPVSEEDFNPASDKLFINAEYIAANSITANQINSSGLKAEQITITTPGNNPKTIFSVDAKYPSQAIIAGFTMNQGELSYTKKDNNITNKVSLGINSIFLGNEQKYSDYSQPGNAFKVNKDGFVQCNYAKIGGWDITSNAIKTNNIELLSDDSVKYNSLITTGQSATRIKSGGKVGKAMLYTGDTVNFKVRDVTDDVNGYGTIVINTNEKITNISYCDVYDSEGYVLSGGSPWIDGSYIYMDVYIESGLWDNLSDPFNHEFSIEYEIEFERELLPYAFQVLDDGSVYASAIQLGTGTIGADNSLRLNTKNMSGTINKIYKNNWRLTVGKNFGVTSEGIVYASNAVLSGELRANKGNIGLLNIHTKDQSVYYVGQMTPYNFNDDPAWTTNTMNAFYTDADPQVSIKRVCKMNNSEAEVFFYDELNKQKIYKSTTQYWIDGKRVYSSVARITFKIPKGFSLKNNSCCLHLIKMDGDLSDQGIRDFSYTYWSSQGPFNEDLFIEVPAGYYVIGAVSDNRDALADTYNEIDKIEAFYLPTYFSIDQSGFSGTISNKVSSMSRSAALLPDINTHILCAGVIQNQPNVLVKISIKDLAYAIKDLLNI